jgi:DNA primase
MISERIKDIDIVDVIQQWGVELRKSGSRLQGKCPFHDDRDPSFFVNPEKQRFYCFGCQQKGDVIDFVQKVRGVDFKESLRILGIQSSGKISFKTKKEIKDRQHQRDLVKRFREWFLKC